MNDVTDGHGAGRVPAEHRGDDGRRDGLDQGMRILSMLIAGPLLYGGLGWLGDTVLSTQFLLPIGIVLGTAGAVFMIIKRYGKVQ